VESSAHQLEIVSQFTRQSRPFAEMAAHSESRSFEVFRELGSFSGNEKVLDSGCGPGLVSLYLAEFVGEINGVDLTPAMVKLAAENASKSGIMNASFLQGNMTFLPFPSGHFDVAVSRYAFHHLEHPAAAFAEMIRVTRCGGKVIVVDVTPEAQKRNAYDCFERLRDPSHTSALTLEELSLLGEEHNLKKPDVIEFGLEVDVQNLIASSFPEEVSRENLVQMLADDLRSDNLSFKVKNEDGSLTMTFPVTAVAWRLS
jgi:SAM-dependent methyltransferase